MSRFEKEVPINFETIEPTREFFEGKQRVIRIIDEKDLKEPMDLHITTFKRKDYASLEEDNPELVKEFDLELNYPLKPSDLSKGTNRKVWWTTYIKERNILFVISWKDKVSHRQRGMKCPYINGYRVHPLFNSLQARYPHIAEQWHPSLNGNLKPTEITSHSAKEIQWQVFHYDERLDKTFELVWSADAAHRVEANGKDNPFLKGLRVHPEFNSLQARFENIAAEWCWELNGSLKPTEVPYGSIKSVYWKCKKCGHIYRASINSRTNMKSGCNNCHKSNFQRFVENMIKNNDIEIETEVNLFKKYRFDIFCEKFNMIIDTDGKQHFSQSSLYSKDRERFLYMINNDNIKNQYALDNGIPLLRVPYLDMRNEKNHKKIERWVLDFIDTRQIPEDIITFYEKKNPLSNYSEIAKVMNTWVTKQKETVAS